MLQHIGTVEEAQERISIFAASESTVGRSLQLLVNNKITNGLVNSRGEPEERRVPDGESVSWGYKQNMVEQLRV